MTTTQANGDRSIKVAKRMEDSAVEVVRLVFRYALAHVAEDDAGHVLQQSGVSKMKKHTVPLVRFRTNVLQKKDAAGAINLRSIRRAKRLPEDRNTASIHPAFRTSGPEDAKAVVNTK